MRKVNEEGAETPEYTWVLSPDDVKAEDREDLTDALFNVFASGIGALILVGWIMVVHNWLS